MYKIAFGLVALFSIAFFTGLGAKSVNASRCWNAGQVVCCMTPEGVICH